jgi:hypothetical protein
MANPPPLIADCWRRAIIRGFEEIDLRKAAGIEASGRTRGEELTPAACVHKYLKAQAHAHLNLARGVNLVQENLSEARGTDVRIRAGELDIVEGVEKLSANVE